MHKSYIGRPFKDYLLTSTFHIWLMQVSEYSSVLTVKTKARNSKDMSFVRSDLHPRRQTLSHCQGLLWPYRSGFMIGARPLYRPALIISINCIGLDLPISKFGMSIVGSQDEASNRFPSKRCYSNLVRIFISQELLTMNLVNKRYALQSRIFHIRINKGLVWLTGLGDLMLECK